MNKAPLSTGQLSRKAEKPSEIYLAAWIAGEDALPEASLQLIKNYNAAHSAWRDAGWPRPIPNEVKQASDAIEADPFAKIAFEFRRQCNRLAHEEWKAEKGCAS